MLKIGSLIHLELEHRGKVERCKCRIVEQTHNQVYIDYPINLETNRTVFLVDGTQVKVSFVSQDQNSVYLFDSQVLGRLKENIPMLILDYPGDDRLVKIQRRQYVRVEANTDVAIHPLADEFKPFTTVTEDISAGGAAVRIRHQIHLAPMQPVIVWLILPLQSGEYRYLKVAATVVRTVHLADESTRVSLQFQDLTPQDVQTLLRFSFDRQLHLKKKGAI